MRKADDFHRGSPYSAPQIGRREQEAKKLSLSNTQILMILGLITVLMVGAFYRLTQQRVFAIDGIASSRQKGRCQVAFHAINRSPSRVSGRAIIQIYEDEDGSPSAWGTTHLAATSSVPISLAAGQSKMVRVDVVHSGLCKQVEVTAVGSRL